MTPLLQDCIVALVPITIMNLGALIFFCGVVVTSLRDHDGRIKRLEKHYDNTLQCAD